MASSSSSSSSSPSFAYHAKGRGLVGMLESNGRFVVFDEGMREEVFAARFAIHLKDWQWRTPVPVSRQRALAVFAQKMMVTDGTFDPDHPAQSWSRVEGNASEIFIHTLISTARDDAIHLKITAVPHGVEPEVSRITSLITLPATKFANGTFCGYSSHRFVQAASAPSEDSHPFHRTSAFNKDLFEFGSSDGSVLIELTVEPLAQQLQPTDVVRVSDSRKWGPNFDVRIQDQGPKLDWSTPLQWSFSLRAIGRTSLYIGAHLPALTLSTEQLKQFHDDGFMILPDLIPNEMIQPALKLINQQLGKTEDDRFQNITSSAILTQLYQYTAIRKLVEDIIGPDDVPAWSGNGVQISLIYPSEHQDIVDPAKVSIVEII